MKLPKNMNNGQLAELKRDFDNTFADAKIVGNRAEMAITGEGLFLWATNTQLWFNWHWERFEKAAQNAVRYHHYHKYYESYRPMFLEWAPYELRPCWYADNLRGLLRGMSYERRAEYDASKAIFHYFRDKFAEENHLTNPEKAVV